MRKKKSVRRKDTKKKRKLSAPKRSVRARRPARTRRRELRGKSGRRRPASRVALGLEVLSSGEVERMSGMARANSESVEQLAEEGQPFEAEVLAGVERADDSDESEVTTHEVPQDDVPPEYDRER
jgi:hypothetical protein